MAINKTAASSSLELTLPGEQDVAISDLPSELLVKILGHLDFSSHINFALTGRIFDQVSYGAPLETSLVRRMRNINPQPYVVTPYFALESPNNSVIHKLTNNEMSIFCEQGIGIDKREVLLFLIVVDRKSGKIHKLPCRTQEEPIQDIIPYGSQLVYLQNKRFMTVSVSNCVLWELSDEGVFQIRSFNFFDAIDLHGVEPFRQPWVSAANFTNNELIVWFGGSISMARFNSAKGAMELLPQVWSQDHLPFTLAQPEYCARHIFTNDTIQVFAEFKDGIAAFQIPLSLVVIERESNKVHRISCQTEQGEALLSGAKNLAESVGQCFAYLHNRRFVTASTSGLLTLWQLSDKGVSLICQSHLFEDMDLNGAEPFNQPWISDITFQDNELTCRIIDLPRREWARFNSTKGIMELLPHKNESGLISCPTKEVYELRRGAYIYIYYRENSQLHIYNIPMNKFVQTVQLPDSTENLYNGFTDQSGLTLVAKKKSTDQIERIFYQF